jgi:hypothetical protein
VIGKPPLLPRILNLQRSQLCYIVGTVYLDMPLKPNVLEDMARDVSAPTYTPYDARRPALLGCRPPSRYRAMRHGVGTPADSSV